MNKPEQKSLNSPEALNRSYIAPEIVRQRQRTIEALDIKTGERVLDIGCGTGFLTYDMASIVGEKGYVLGLDLETAMVESTLTRCVDLKHVEARAGDVCNLDATDSSFDIVTCTQVLLYVQDIERALQEIWRVLKPGGRIALLETDWRGTVMSSSYPELTRRIIDAWDGTVASPNLPPRLFYLLKSQGFNAIRTEAIPLLNTSYSRNSFSVNSIAWLAKNAYRQEMISKEEGKKWVEDLEALGERDAYFFCLNRFLFIAVK
jgi:ubiquinone/menaquinone biosynthesis C-methylase UbiE